MEYINSVWQVGVIALVAGAIIGALAYRLLAPSIKEAGKIKGELSAAQKELNEYKTSVNQHFDKTSELVNDLTQNYVKVHQHLANGAQSLGDGRNFTNLLEQHQGKASIALDDESNAPEQTVEDSVVDVTVAPTASVETADDLVKSVNDVSADEPDSGYAEGDAAEAKVSTSSGGPDDLTEAAEPVLNVDVLDQVNEEPGIEKSADAENVVLEVEEKDEVRTTTH